MECLSEYTVYQTVKKKITQYDQDYKAEDKFHSSHKAPVVDLLIAMRAVLDAFRNWISTAITPNLIFLKFHIISGKVDYAICRKQPPESEILETAFE